MNRTYAICSWNVRGLGDRDKCSDVLMELLSSHLDIVLLQETKLDNITAPKRASFLLHRLNSYRSNPSIGMFGGILTAWSDNAFSLLHTSSTANTLSVHLSSTSSPLSFVATNVYAPFTPDQRTGFLDELRSVAPPSAVPWIVGGDFNMIRYAHEKNNDNFRSAEADAFNECIDSMCLIELPLVDRSFTWSNRRSHPTLEKLDRFFINLS